MLGRIILVWTLVSFLPLAPAQSANIDLVDYWVMTVGQWSTFSYSSPPGFPGFTVTLTTEKSGGYIGKYRMGNFNTPDPARYIWVIYHWDVIDLILYETSSGPFDPPVRLPRILPLNTLVDNPLEADVAWYLTKLDSFTVPAGTFHDVLVWFNLDKKTNGPNAVNAQYGLSSLPYGISGAEWYGRNVGQLQELDVDSVTGATRWLFALQAYGLKKPGPPYLLLLN
jgi:hypothetical protein